MALADDRCAAGMHRNPHPRDIDRQERASVLPGQDAAGFQRLPAPAIKAKYPVGFRDDIPALQIGELAAIGLAGPDHPGIEVAPERRELFA